MVKIKVKFRVFITKYCNGTNWPCDDKNKACKIKHEFSTHRYIFRHEDGVDEEDCIQKAHRYVVGMLDHENRRDKDKKKQQRPWFQYTIPMEA